MNLILKEVLDNGYIHKLFDNKLETWTLYDKDSRLLHNKISDGNETWQSYDTIGNLIYAKDVYINGEIFEMWWEYDNNGKLVKFHNSNGYEYNY